MSSAALKWTKIQAELPRSSHSISLIDNKAYLYGGEINPREPVDGQVHVIDLDSGAYEKIEGNGDVPEPRVGHVAGVVDGKIYVFGGRGGPSMSPLDEAGAVYAFHPSTSTWTKITPSSPGYPCARSYHTATVTSTHLIIHAGCGDASTGRLNDTWFFDIASRAWTKAADAPGDPRGGTAIAVLDNKLWRFGGFNGKTELGGSIDALDLSGSKLEEATWQTSTFGEAVGLSREDDHDLTAGGTAPGPRSVHALLPLNGKLVTLFGEGKPSHTGGHDAAGNFWDDVWAYNAASGRWEEVNVEGEKPAARGWFASTMAQGNALALWGGLNAKNERLTDGWILRAE